MASYRTPAIWRQGLCSPHQSYFLTFAFPPSASLLNFIRSFDTRSCVSYFSYVSVCYFLLLAFRVWRLSSFIVGVCMAFEFFCCWRLNGVWWIKMLSSYYGADTCFAFKIFFTKRITLHSGLINRYAQQERKRPRTLVPLKQEGIALDTNWLHLQPWMR